jgi:uncharacterized protein (TIGR00290 family)
MKKYEEEFKKAVSGLKGEGVGRMVFGDVYLDEHREWVERVTGELGIEPLEPLWGIPPEDVVGGFLKEGFSAVIVSCKADILGKEYLGRTVDRHFLNELRQKNICPCGENGEFHTLVVDGPIFQSKLEILESEPVLRKGFARYWFLDIKKTELKKKIAELKPSG